MYYRQFFAKLVAALKAAGFTKVEYPYEGADFIIVAGCRFYAETQRRGNRSTIKFEGWRFPYPYVDKSISKAVSLVIQSLPQKVEELKKEQKREKMYQDANQVNKSLRATRGMSMFAAGEEYYLQFKHADKSTILAAIDYLQDGGFCDQCPPTVDEDSFGESQEQRTIDAVCKLLESLPSAETRREISRRIAREYAPPVDDVYPSDEV